MVKDITEEERFANVCSKCGHRAGTAGKFAMYDHCDVCKKFLCTECMRNGCCENIPAVSGDLADAEREVEDA